MKLVSAHSRHPRAGLTAAPLQILIVIIVALGSGAGTARWLSEGQTKKFPGYVHPRTTTITAPRTGVLSSIVVHSGDSLDPGTVIGQMADEKLESEFGGKHGEIAAMQAQLQQAQAQAELTLALNIREIDADICDLQLLAADYQKEKYDFELRRNMIADSLAGNQVAVLGQTDSVYSSLVSGTDDNSQDRMITILGLKRAENAVEVSVAQIEWCEWNKVRLEKLRAHLPDVVRRSAGVDVLTARLQQAQSDLDHLSSAREGLQIKSNAVGRAGVLRVTPGASVVQGTPVIDVLDDIARVVEVQVPSENILQFHEGDTVKLTFPGRLQRTGRIAAVAPQAQLLTSGAAGDESFVDVRIEACGEQWPEVPAGSRVVVRLASSIWSL